MYRPAFFKEERAHVLSALMRAAPFAHLVLATEAGLEANGLPLRLREREGGLTLAGHVARSNPVWQMELRGEALAIFSGPQGYITPSAYASKKQDGKVVPTWNYVMVHAYGTLRWVHDDAWLAQLLEELTDEHEAGRAEPWRVSDAPAAFTAGQRRAIVGLELTVTRVEGKLKLGQNRSRADREARPRHEDWRARVRRPRRSSPRSSACLRLATGGLRRQPVERVMAGRRRPSLRFSSKGTR